MKRALISLAIIPVAAWCQKPVISSVVNAASYQTTTDADGAIATIFGTNLAASVEAANAFPLPRQLGGTTVTRYGIAAPLLYVSPTQINFQMPSYGDQVPGVGTAPAIVVSTAAGTSDPYSETGWRAVGIFTMDGSGCGQGAVLNVGADGSSSLNSPENSASPGDWITVFGTGIYPIMSPPPDGVVTPLKPLAEGGYATALFDSVPAQTNVWAGLAPGYVGLDQFNVQIPANVREGCAVPLQIIDGFITQPVTIAIHNGGGPCTDPPVAGYGQITWEKTVTTTVQHAVSETDTTTLSLQASPGNRIPSPPAFAEGLGFGQSITYFGPSCPVPGYRSLDAGTVTMQGPGLGPTQVPIVPQQQGQAAVFYGPGAYGPSPPPAPKIPLPQGQVSGISVYQVSLAPGSIQAGKFTVAASGGGDVGAFQASTQIGSDIQITTPLEGSVVSIPCQPLTINWTGGDPNSWVTVSLVQQQPGFEAYSYGWFYQAHASDGTLSWFVSPGEFSFICLSPPSPVPVEIVVEVDPDPSQLSTFWSPKGLSLNGQVWWRYIHRFEAFQQ